MRRAQAVTCWVVMVALVAVATAPADAAGVRVLDPAAADVAVERVLAGEVDAHFHASASPRMLMSHSAQPRWLRLDPDPTLREGRWVLSITRVPLRELSVYLPDGEGGWRERTASFFRHGESDYAPHAYAFPLDAAAADLPVYIRIVHGGRLYLNLAVQSEDAFRRTERQFVVAITAGFTALAVMLLMNLVFWFRLRETMYLTYVAFIAGLMGWTVFATGLAQPWWPALAHWSVPGSPSGFLVALSMALMLHFVRQFVELARNDRPADRALRTLALAFGALAGAYLLPGAGEWPPLAGASSLLFALLPPLLLGVLLRCGWRGSRAAWLFLVAWLPLGVLSGMCALTGLGVLPPTPLNLFGPLGAVAFESIVLAVGLAGHALELRLQRDRALRLAQIDPLTGALNRRAGEARLQEMFEAAKARGVSLALMFLDMDRLKRINDNFSHDAGDLCLRVLVGRVQALMPPRAEVVRWGGDEFVLLLPGLFAADAEVLAARVREALEATPVPFDGEELYISASIGVSSFDDQVDTPQELVRRADMALYALRRARRSDEAGRVGVEA